MRRALHAAVVAVSALPAAWLAFGAATDRLGPEPVEALLHGTGGWALRFLLLSLAVTPLRRAFGLALVAPWRRSLGLAAFGYACAHLALYAALELELDLGQLAEDVAERPFVTAGFAAWLLLVPLAATSTRAMQRRLGRRWVRLHRLVYAALGLALVHFLWGVKADLREPLVYAAVGALLLAARWRPRGAAAPVRRGPGRPLAGAVGSPPPNGRDSV
jgi:sulfoxide reductase heme-binding subunit YedZ